VRPRTEGRDYETNSLALLCNVMRQIVKHGEVL
jgi:hypothetical protein